MEQKTEMLSAIQELSRLLMFASQQEAHITDSLYVEAEVLRGGDEAVAMVNTCTTTPDDGLYTLAMLTLLTEEATETITAARITIEDTEGAIAVVKNKIMKLSATADEGEQIYTSTIRLTIKATEMRRTMLLHRNQLESVTELEKKTADHDVRLARLGVL